MYKNIYKPVSMLSMCLSIILSIILGTVICTSYIRANILSQPKPVYIDPSFKIVRGQAPGMQVKLLSELNGRKDYMITFRTGDEAICGLIEFAEKYHITNARFTAIGACSKGLMGSYTPAKKMYTQISVDEQSEIASMIGNITLVNREPAIHCHIVVSSVNGAAKGGHVFQIYVRPTLEVMMIVEPEPLEKRFDKDAGLFLIDATPHVPSKKAV